MSKSFSRCLLGAALVLIQIPFAGAAEQADLLLALAMDVSRSIDQSKFLLQREGYAAAISNLQVLDAIKSGPRKRIAVCFIDWSGPSQQQLVIDWSVIDGIATAHRFGDLILKASRPFNESTSIGGGIDFAAGQLSRAPFEAYRHTIDVSGDGTNNAGHDVQLDRDRAVAKGITINGMVILTDIKRTSNARHTNPPEGLERYYRDNVIGGRGSFVMVAEDISSFGRAIARKLTGEIAAGPAQLRKAAADW
jgi:Protein of unknown function (DUF1194)